MRFRLIVTIACLAWMLAPVAILRGQDQNSDIQQHFLTAQRAQESGDLERAAAEYRAVLRIDPSSAEAYRNLGLLDYVQNKYDDCAAMMKKALSLKPGIPGANLYLGISEAKLNRPDLAISPLSKAREQEPANKEANTWLAKALWDSGQTTQALLLLEKAVHAFPSDVDMPFLLGEAYRKAAANEFEAISKMDPKSPILDQAVAESLRLQGQPDKAIQQYQRLLKKDPRWLGAHLGMASVLLSQGKLDEAANQFQQELSLDPASIRAKAGLAEVAFLESRVDDGLNRLREVIASNPSEAKSLFLSEALEPMRERYRAALGQLRKHSAIEPAPLHLATGLLDARLGDQAGLQREAAEFEKALRVSGIKPAVPQPSGHARAEIRFESHDYQGASLELRRLITSNPKELRARYLLGKCYEALATQTLEELVVKAPDSFRAHQLLAQIHKSQGQNEKALAEYRIVARMQPGLPGLHYAIGDLLWAMGQDNDAVIELGKELDLNPNHVESNAAIGTIHVSRGEPEKGIPYLQRAIALQPNLLPAHRELGRAYLETQKYEQAETELRLALPIDDDGSIHYMLGNLYREIGRKDDAVKMLQAAAEMKAASRPVAERPDKQDPH